MSEITNLIKNNEEYSFADTTARSNIGVIAEELNNLEIPDKTSDLINDSDYVTANYVKTNYLNLSGGTLTGTLSLEKGNNILVYGSTKNVKGLFYVDSGDYTTLAHRTKASILSTEQTDSILKFNQSGLYFSTGNTTSITEQESNFKKVLTEADLKTINGESIIGEGNIVIQGGGGSGAYLPLSGGTLTGHLVLGDGNTTAFKKVEAIRQVNNIPNGAAFYVNSDGTASFFHKTYGSTALAGAVNDAILRFNNEGLYFAKGATNRTSATDYKEVLTEETAYKKSEVYNKTEIDAMIGNINNILNSI